MTYRLKKYDLLKEDLVYIIQTADEQKSKRCINVVDIPRDRMDDLLKKAFLEIQSKDNLKSVFQECGIDISDYELMYYK
jgi:predicted XRE-type DNA-binding protein